jgi:hypothetical protein
MEYSTVPAICGIGDQVYDALWYEIIFPSENRSLCAVADVQTVNTDSVALSVYSGSSCNSLSCIAQNSNGQNTLVWKANSGDRFHLVISRNQFIQRGDFTLNVKVSAETYFLYIMVTVILYSLLLDGGLSSKQ